MAKKLLLAGGIILILALGFWYARTAWGQVISSDKTITGDLQIPAGKKLTIKNGATLTVTGKLTVDGQINCEHGSLHLVASTIELNNNLSCDQVNDSDITIVATESLSFGVGSEIVSNGNVQIAGRIDDLAKSPEKFEEYFDEAGKDSGSGLRVGPLAASENQAAAFKPVKSDLEKISGVKPAHTTSPRFSFINRVSAHGDGPEVVISGKIKVNTPPPGIHRIVVFNFPDASGLHLQNFELEGPDAANGTDDKGNSCNAHGEDGVDAMRFLAFADNLKVDNFTLKLGNGGGGGDAETTKDCSDAKATGGKGGNSGNFKMMAGANFEIVGTFTVIPGKGGDGGEARAYGKEGKAPEEKGGDATASGGKGADNKKVFRINGNVSGTGNIQFASAYGGDGGDTTATGGRGGDGKGCKSNGGPGGKAKAMGGRGGDAKLTLAGSAVRTPEAEDRAGNGGDANSRPGAGGGGGNCGPEGPGGHGGRGGDATATKGLKGQGTSANALDGIVGDETGGNGGNGGDGCGPGDGGNGGNGNPKGQDGKPGNNKCVPPNENRTQITPPPVTGPGDVKKTAKVIEYNGKYLPIDQLIVEAEKGCDGGQAHWHAAAGIVKATDGSMVVDPGPQCGYGKQSEKPVIEVEVTLQ